MLVHGSVEVGAQLICGRPELLFEIVEELLFYGFHAPMPCSIYISCRYAITDLRLV